MSEPIQKNICKVCGFPFTPKHPVEDICSSGCRSMEFTLGHRCIICGCATGSSKKDYCAACAGLYESMTDDE